MSDFITASSYCESVFDGTHDTPKPVNSGYPLVTSKHIVGRTLDIKTAYNISFEDYNSIQKRSRVSQWDVLFSMIGSVGEVHLEKNDSIPYAIKNIGVFSCKNEEKAKWLYYYLQSPFATTHIKRYLNGAVQKFLSLGALREFPVLKFNKQSSLITKVLSDLDAKIELNNKINRELEAMAKTLYDYWFVQFDFPNQAGKPYKSSGGKMVYNAELKREIPEGWEAGNLDDIGTIIGGSTPSKANSEFFSEGNHTPWITPKDLSLNKDKKFITRGEFDVTEEGIKNASLKVMPKGTVLLSSRAPIGYLAISRESVTTNQGFKSFVPNKGFSTFFIYYTVQKMIPTIINNAVGSTFKEVSGSTLKSIKIPIPSKHTLENFDMRVSSIFKKQDCLELENQHLTALRDWLLPMLMNGQVTVRETEERISLAAEPSVKYGK